MSEYAHQTSGGTLLHSWRCETWSCIAMEEDEQALQALVDLHHAGAAPVLRA